MIKPDSRFFSCRIGEQDCRIHYLNWGEASQPVLVCAHGLTRNARDFDWLARDLCDRWRVIVVDFPGRGQSDWLEDKSGYTVPTYVQVSLALLADLNCGRVAWLGTSMGGLVGMVMAALPGTSVNRLILNDVGPELAPQALERIGDYLAQDIDFADLDAFEVHLREIHAPFGSLTDEQWRHLALHSHGVRENGRVGFSYDPGIAVPFREAPVIEADLWELWSSIQVPLHLIYGENSDILTAGIIEKMQQLQPGLISQVIENTGHAPALMDPAQIAKIRDWLV